MKYLLFSTMRGRVSLLLHKVLFAAALDMGVWCIVYGWEASAFFFAYAPSSLSAPVQSLALFADFPLPVSIRTFYILLGILRFFMLFACSLLIMLLSAGADKTENSALICSVILLPSLLGESLKILPFQTLSLSRAVSMVELIWQNRFAPVCFLMAGMVLGCGLVFMGMFCTNRTRHSYFN